MRNTTGEEVEINFVEKEVITQREGAIETIGLHVAKTGPTEEEAITRGTAEGETTGTLNGAEGIVRAGIMR